MKPLSPSRLYLALLHYPVKNKDGDIIASAITNLDLHDIARAGRTYGVGAYYVITPLFDQQELAGKIVSHWQEGVGAQFNPDRREALDLIRVRAYLSDAVAEIRKATGMPVHIVATSAADDPKRITFLDFRRMLEMTDRSYLLVFGTAWGLTGEFMESVDHVLVPIRGKTGYNHLSVRSAAAIILDRISGEQEIL